MAPTQYEAYTSHSPHRSIGRGSPRVSEEMADGRRVYHKPASNRLLSNQSVQSREEKHPPSTGSSNVRQPSQEQRNGVEFVSDEQQTPVSVQQLMHEMAERAGIHVDPGQGYADYEVDLDVQQSRYVTDDDGCITESETTMSKIKVGQNQHGKYGYEERTSIHAALPTTQQQGSQTPHQRNASPRTPQHQHPALQQQHMQQQQPQQQQLFLQEQHQQQKAVKQKQQEQQYEQDVVYIERYKQQDMQQQYREEMYREYQQEQQEQRAVQHSMREQQETEREARGYLRLQVAERAAKAKRAKVKQQYRPVATDDERDEDPVQLVYVQPSAIQKVRAAPVYGDHIVVERRSPMPARYPSKSVSPNARSKRSKKAKEFTEMYSQAGDSDFERYGLEPNYARIPKQNIGNEVHKERKIRRAHSASPEKGSQVTPGSTHSCAVEIDEQGCLLNVMLTDEQAGTDLRFGRRDIQFQPEPTQQEPGRDAVVIQKKIRHPPQCTTPEFYTPIEATAQKGRIVKVQKLKLKNPKHGETNPGSDIIVTHMIDQTGRIVPISSVPKDIKRNAFSAGQRISIQADELVMESSSSSDDEYTFISKASMADKAVITEDERNEKFSRQAIRTIRPADLRDIHGGRYREQVPRKTPAKTLTEPFTYAIIDGRKVPVRYQQAPY